MQHATRGWMSGVRICRIPARHLYGDIEPAVNLILSLAGSR
jgi:hypothetical protein